MMGKIQQMDDDVAGGEESISKEKLMEYLRKEVPDWDEEVKCIGRFKAFSGQRTDWEPLYVFWRDLILKVARHFHIFIIRPSQVEIWFNRGGMIPLCLDQVLLEMYTAGELLRNVGVSDPARGWVSQFLQRVVNLGGLLRPSTQEKLAEDYYIIPVLLKEKALQVVQALSESHWTASCVITWRKFQEISGGLKEAHAVLNHLCEHGKAKYLATNKKDLVEVKLVGILFSVCISCINTMFGSTKEVERVNERETHHFPLKDLSSFMASYLVQSEGK